jgi:hypothetical protein
MKLFLALVALLAITATAYAAAASLGVTGGTVQVGSVSVSTACGLVDVAYQVNYDSGPDQRFEDSGVILTASSSTCNGMTADVQLLNGSNNLLGTAHGTFASGTTGTLPVASSPAAHDVIEVQIVVH